MSTQGQAGGREPENMYLGIGAIMIALALGAFCAGCGLGASFSNLID